MPPRPWVQPPEQQQAATLRVVHRQLPGVLAAAGGSEGLFWHLFGGSSSRGCAGNCANGNRSHSAGTADAAADTFWLDSATPDRGRFSFMGGRGGSLWQRIEYRLPPPGQQQQQQQQPGSGAAQPQQGTLVLTAADGIQHQLSTDFFGWLERLLASRRCAVRCATQPDAAWPGCRWPALRACFNCLQTFPLLPRCAAAPRPLPPCPSTFGEGWLGTLAMSSRQSAAGAPCMPAPPPMPPSSWLIRWWLWTITAVRGVL